MAVEAGPVGIITGGLSGIGAASAVEFARIGARMILTDRSLTGTEGILERVRTAGGDAISMAADVRDPRSNDAVVEEAVRRWHRIDFLLANAGIADQSRIATGDPERWRGDSRSPASDAPRQCGAGARYRLFSVISCS